MSLRERAIQIAKEEVGVTEDPVGSNWGPRVSQYIKTTGFDEPVFWCLCFVYWCVEQAAKAEGTKNPLPKTGSCDMLLHWARRNGHIRANPEPGDLFLVMASQNDAIHVGFVTGKAGNGRITTVEGNTNTDGSRNGIKVAARERSVGSLEFVSFAAAAVRDFSLIIGEKKIPNLPVIEGATYAPIRTIVQMLGLDEDKLVFDPEIRNVTYDGKVIPASPFMKDGRTHFPVRTLATFFGLELLVDEKAKEIKFSRPEVPIPN